MKVVFYTVTADPELANIEPLLLGETHGEVLESFPGDTSGKEPICQCRRRKRHGLDPWVRKIPCRRTWQPTLVLLPRESHGQRSLAGCSPQDHKESDRTEATKQQHVALWAVCYVLLAYDFNLQLRGKTVHKYDDDGDGFSDTH